MGYMKEQTGWCDHCNGRRLVRRSTAPFAPWRCTVCGGRIRIVGDAQTEGKERAHRASRYDVQGMAVEEDYTWVLRWAAMAVVLLVLALAITLPLVGLL